MIANEVKAKVFHKYAAGCFKTREKLQGIEDPESHTVTFDNKKKAEILSNFFSSVFTKEDKDNIPKFKEGN